MVLGLMGDAPQRLRKAAAYLEGDRKYNIVPEVGLKRKGRLDLSLVPDGPSPSEAAVPDAQAPKRKCS
jgi:hypothetical protein